jgi:ribosomal-protein-alanine N-acetyltransferase
MHADDAEDLHVARGDPAAMRWWYAGVSQSLEETRAEVANMATWDTSWSFGRFGSDEAIGYVGFHGLGTGEGCGFGYLLRRSEWGCGLVVEAARAALAYGFDTVGIRHAELWIDPGNRQSMRVAEKLGARFRGWANTGRLSVTYGITIDEWRGELRPPIAMCLSAVLGVNDLDRAIALWVDGLGFRRRFSTDEVAQVVMGWTSDGGVRLVQRPMPAGRVLVQVGADVDEVVTRATAAGWQLAAPPTNQPWGTRDATVTDPDGNAVLLQGRPD